MAIDKLAILGGEPIRYAPFPKWPVWDAAEEDAVLRVVRSGAWWRVGGHEVERFEQEFAEAHGARFGIANTSGTVALRLALWACGVRAGDEVIVPPYTFLATATAVVEQNATPVFVDIDPETYNLDPTLIEAAMTPRTKAIIPVHFAGCAAAMGEILEIGRRNNLSVIEDAAHAHGGAWRGQGLGSIGAMGCFSFQDSKNMTAGEGGIVITNDEALAEECRSIHNFGRRPGGAWYEHNLMASNYRMTEFQGAVLRCQLARLKEQTAVRQANAARLTNRLSKIPGIAPQPRGEDETVKAYHLYLFRFDAQAWGVPRERFVEAMNAEGIPVTAGYQIPLYRQPIFSGAHQLADRTSADRGADQTSALRPDFGTSTFRPEFGSSALRPDFGPYTAGLEQGRAQDYASLHLPVSERACSTEGCWMHQSVLLATERDIDDIADAFEKVWEGRAGLTKLRALP